MFYKFYGIHCSITVPNEFRVKKWQSSPSEEQKVSQLESGKAF